MYSYLSIVSLYSEDISLKNEDIFAFHSLNLPPLTYNYDILKKYKYFNLRQKVRAVSFHSEIKYLNLFFKKAQLFIRSGKFKECNAKNKIEKSPFFNEISLEYKETKLPWKGPHQWHSGNAQNWKTGGARFKPRSRLST